MEFCAKLFGSRLQELRKERSFTTETLAVHLGTTSATISRWENGLLNPTAYNIFKIAVFFNISAGYIIGTEH